MNQSFLPEWDPSPYPSFEDLVQESKVINKEWDAAEKIAETRLNSLLLPGIGYVSSLALAVNYGIPSGNPALMTLSIAASIFSTGVLQHYARSFLRADAERKIKKAQWHNSIDEIDYCFERINKE